VNCFRSDLNILLLYNLLTYTAVDVPYFIMQNLLRCQTVLRRLLFRPNLSFTQPYLTGSEFSGPPPTEPVVGAYVPLNKGWNDHLQDQMVPKEVDIAIIGGGLVGLCTAFFIKHKFPRVFNIVVIEKDPLVRLLLKVFV